MPKIEGFLLGIYHFRTNKFTGTKKFHRQADSHPPQPPPHHLSPLQSRRPPPPRSASPAISAVADDVQGIPSCLFPSVIAAAAAQNIGIDKPAGHLCCESLPLPLVHTVAPPFPTTMAPTLSRLSLLRAGSGEGRLQDESLLNPEPDVET